VHQVGFGLLRNGKACGIWPLPTYELALERAERSRTKDVTPAEYHIVPIFTGNPVPVIKKAD